ncbi:hypothetical protein Tco_1226271 [Tanacetum coccineum]
MGSHWMMEFSVVSWTPRSQYRLSYYSVGKKIKRRERMKVTDRFVSPYSIAAEDVGSGSARAEGEFIVVQDLSYPIEVLRLERLHGLPYSLQESSEDTEHNIWEAIHLHHPRVIDPEKLVDLPVKARTRDDIGVAVADSPDVARGVYDIVLTEPGVSVIVNVVLTSRGKYLVPS